MIARVVVLFSAALALSAAAPVPEPAPPAPPAMFGGSPGRNLANPTATNLPSEWSIDKDAPKNVKWKAQLGNVSYLGGAVVAEGKVFVGTNNERPRAPNVKGDRGVLMCFDEKTGNFLWQIAHEKLKDDAIDNPRCGLVSTPGVEAGKLYYVSNRCELVCAETANGKVVWSLDLIGQLRVYPGGLQGSLSTSSPLIVDDLAIVGTSNGVDAATGKPKNPKAPSLIAVEKATGKVVWQDASPGNDILDGQWSSPAAAKIAGRWQVIYGYGDGWLRGLDARTGEVLWKFDCNPKGLEFNPNKKDSKNYIVATPVFHDGKVYIAVGMEPDSPVGFGHLWCIDPAKKPANKELDLSPVDNDFDPKSPKNKDSGLVWHHGGAILPKPPGNERQAHFHRSVSPVAVHDGVVYAVEALGYLQALDAATGKKLWEVDFDTGTWASPYYADGKVYVGGETGEVFVFQAGRTRKLLAKVEMSHAVRTPPVAANGVLFLSDGDGLYALRAEK